MSGLTLALSSHTANGGALDTRLASGIGGRLARSFSNTPDSKQSNIGLMKTAETYPSRKFGYSLRLDGLEKGFNDNARRRAIVMHRADYATEAFAHRHGRLGRSLGCPGLHRDGARGRGWRGYPTRGHVQRKAQGKRHGENRGHPRRIFSRGPSHPADSPRYRANRVLTVQKLGP